MSNPRWTTALWISAAALLVLAVLVKGAMSSKQHDSTAPGPTVFLKDVGPRSTSNQTEQPLALYGEGFKAGMRLTLGAPFGRELPLTVLDERHAFVRLPADLDLPAEVVEQSVRLSILGGDEGSGQAQLTLVNDAHFPDLVGLASSRDGRFAFTLSTTTDALFAIDVETETVKSIRVGDGPSALANYVDTNGQEWIVVAHAFAPELHLISVNGPGLEHQVWRAPAYATGIAIDPDAHRAFVAEHARDTISALDLLERGRVLWTTPVGPNPRALALAGEFVAVGSLQAGVVELVERSTGRLVKSIAPIPGTPIIGGHTERYSKYAMGGKAPRNLAWSAKLGRLFESSVGPNIGPNPDRWEISPNGGIGVLDPAAGKFIRHLGFGAGVPEGLALDDRSGLLFAADIALGVIRIVDARRLNASDGDARKALLETLPIPPPSGFPTARPVADYGVSGRAGVELHSGPRELVLSADRSTLLVVNRFTGMLAVIDVRQAGKGRATLQKQIRIADMLTQPKRRIGQVLYFADMGRSGMSCDTCHLEGHTEGIFFEKTHPMRIYRATTVRGSRETPPYFTPASTFTLAQTNRFVGSRNRLHNPDLTQAEIDALTAYVQGIVTLPNPFVEADGSPSETLGLPDGQTGHPRLGMTIFNGKAGCAECHPAPLFTTDQDPSTRGRYLKVGTPTALPVRLEMQDLLNRGFAPPSLLGAWDIFPMLTSGAAGLEVRSDGSVAPSTRFPLRIVIEMYGNSPHGHVGELTAEERNDLLAFLLSL